MLQESAYQELDVLSDWELEHKEQDIRNRPLVTPTGERLGIIDDLLVDTGAERVAAVRLEDGRVCAVEALEIHPEQVIYRPAGEVEAYGADSVVDYDAEANTYATANIDGDTIQVVEEEVAVGKRAVVGDTIKVSSRVVTDTVSESISLTDEEAVVAVNEVNEVISPSEADALFQEKTIEVTEIHEEPVVAKRAVVKEEIELGKVAEQHTETVSETVRRTVVDIDETAATATTAATSATATAAAKGKSMLDKAGNALDNLGDDIEDAIT